MEKIAQLYSNCAELLHLDTSRQNSGLQKVLNAVENNYEKIARRLTKMGKNNLRFNNHW